MNSSRGITLIEVLVVTAIMFILLGISFVGYRERGKELELQRAAFKVMADVERVRGMAMSAQEEEFSGKVPAGGWGIYFDNGSLNKYIIFADKTLPLDYSYDPAEGPGETIFLEEGIILKIPASVNIVFLPPSPDVYLQGGAPLLNEVNIIIALVNNPSKTKTITVNSAGLIYISN